MATTNLLDQTKALEFILAGKAIFTAKSLITQKHFTYRVSIPKDQKPETATIWFVSVLTGTNNESDYSFIGSIRKTGTTVQYKHSPKSKIGLDAPSAAAIHHIVNFILAFGKTNPNLEIWHEGRCCRCGRKLTTPESVELGIGPECLSIKDKSRLFA